jgi:hypothetical protein
MRDMTILFIHTSLLWASPHQGHMVQHDVIYIYDDQYIHDDIYDENDEFNWPDGHDMHACMQCLK